jgi:hypothetical protein
MPEQHLNKFYVYTVRRILEIKRDPFLSPRGLEGKATVGLLVGEVNNPSRKPMAFEMGDYLPAQSLLNPLILKWFSTDKPRSTRILRDEDYLRSSIVMALQLGIPRLTVDQFPPTPNHEVLVVRVGIVNVPVEAGENPLLIETFTSCHSAGTMSWRYIPWIEILEYISDDVRCAPQKWSVEVARYKPEILFRSFELSHYGPLLRGLERDFKLVTREEDLP